ncbi:MAG: hypothetical protein FK732_07790, partial [Asgard group archaeon]|nr:hypothetical protein [Asgard group archaeon]
VYSTAHASNSEFSLISIIPESQNDADKGVDAGDTIDNATIIGTGIFNGSLPEDDDNDFYTVYIGLNRFVVITLSGDNGTDFDLHFFAPNEHLLLSSQNSDSNEYIEIETLDFGYWFVRVEKYNLTIHGNYTLMIDTSAITSTDPSTDQNDAGSGGDAGNNFYSATEISRGRSYGMLIDYDFFDYYKIDLVMGDQISIVLTYTMGTNFDLFFYDPDANRIGLSTSGVTEERIELNIYEVGFHRILVSRLVGNGTYELYIQINHPNDLDFNWKALVAFGAAIIILIVLFITIRYIGRRTSTRLQRYEIKGKSESSEQKDLDQTDQNILNFDEAIAKSGKDMSEEEKETIDRIIREYSIEKKKEEN